MAFEEHLQNKAVVGLIFKYLHPMEIQFFLWRVVEAWRCLPSIDEMLPSDVGRDYSDGSAQPLSVPRITEMWQRRAAYLEAAGLVSPTSPHLAPPFHLTHGAMNHTPTTNFLLFLFYLPLLGRWTLFFSSFRRVYFPPPVVVLSVPYLSNHNVCSCQTDWFSDVALCYFPLLPTWLMASLQSG